MAPLSTNSDEVWKQEIRKITDPSDLMNELALLYLEISGVGDPYYKDLYEEICKRAVELRPTFDRARLAQR